MSSDPVTAPRSPRRRSTAGRCAAVGATLVLAASGWPAGGAFAVETAAETVKEYEVKAAFLYNFAKFTTWPDDAYRDDEAPFVIGLLGRDPFGRTLDDTLKGKKVGTRPVRVLRYERLEQVGAPHLLFVAESDEKRVAAVLKDLGTKPILLVGDAAGFAARGGAAGFYLEESNVRFEMNPAALKRARLVVAAQVLKLARIVEG